MAAAASGTWNRFSETVIIILDSPPAACWTLTRASYMLWLHARSFLALGVISAILICLVMAGTVAAIVAVIACGIRAAPPTDLRTRTNTRTTHNAVKHTLIQ